MKKIILLLFVAFAFSEAHPTVIQSGDEDQLSSLLDSFSVAMVKKDKAWMAVNLSGDCKMYEPAGNTLDRAGIIRTFTEGIYNVSKSSALKKVFKIDGADAYGSADFNVEGTGNVNGNMMDIAGTYLFNLKFKKSDNGWQISEISINQN